MRDWKCFVLMPFANSFDDVYLLIRDLAHLDSLSGLKLFRADDIDDPGRITDQIIDAIQKSDFVIADVTGSNPNVMFELGYAGALGKPAIILNQEVAGSPFDIREMRQVVYDRTRLVGDLRPQLVSAVEAVLARLLRAQSDEAVTADANGVGATPDQAAATQLAEQQAAQLSQHALSLDDVIARLEALELEIDLARAEHDTARLQQSVGELKSIVDRLNVVDESPDARSSLASELGDLAVSLHNASLYREAEDLFNRAMSLGVQHPGVHLQYALFVALHKRDYEKAQSLLDRAQRLGVDTDRLSRARAQIAGARAIRGGTEEADPSLIEQIRSMYEAHPDSWEAFVSYMALLHRTRDYEEVDRVCAQRLEVSGRDPHEEAAYRVMRAWADALASSRQPERMKRAAELYTRILDARESDAEVLNNLATLMMHGSPSERAKAIRFYARAVKLSPNSVSIRRALAHAITDVSGRRDFAVKVLRGGELTEDELDVISPEARAEA